MPNNEEQLSMEMPQQWDACPQSRRELRLQIDNLRLRNQQLHIALDLAQRRQTVVRKAMMGAISDARTFLRRLRHAVNYQSQSGNSAASTSNFKPYQVHIRNTPLPHRPRILHIIANFYTGGSAQLVVDLIERLGHRFEQEIISRDLPASPGYTGMRLHHLELFRSPAQTRMLLQRLKPNLVHVHYLGHRRNAYSTQDWRWYHQLFGALEQHHVPVIENLNIPVAPYVSPNVRCYVHVSDFVKCHFGRLDSRNLTIYPGSDLNFFARPEDSSFPDDCIGMVYRLEGDKLSPESIDVLIEVVRRRKNTRAMIVGGGTYLTLYQQRVRQAGLEDAFTFTGYVSYNELPQRYEQMSLFVAPVHTESFGQVSAFAMGMALPVVGYRAGALPEIVGDVDLLAPPEDSAALAEIIIDLLDDRTRRLEIGAANRERAQERFSVEAMIEQYEQLYEEVLV